MQISIPYNKFVFKQVAVVNLSKFLPQNLKMMIFIKKCFKNLATALIMFIVMLSMI